MFDIQVKHQAQVNPSKSEKVVTNNSKHQQTTTNNFLDQLVCVADQQTNNSQRFRFNFSQIQIWVFYPKINLHFEDTDTISIDLK